MGVYRRFSLKELIEQIGEEKVNDILSNFSCPLNRDVEYFLHHRAVQFSKSALAPTHLVFCDVGETDSLILVGYFTLTTKAFSIPRDIFSNTQYRKVKSFSIGDSIDGNLTVPAPLIAQLGKNYTDGADCLISGNDLIGIALMEIEKIQLIAGGRICYVECEDKKPLFEFYTRQGFQEFQRRLLDKDEKKNLSGKELIQLLRYKK